MAMRESISTNRFNSAVSSEDVLAARDILNRIKKPSRKMIRSTLKLLKDCKGSTDYYERFFLIFVIEAHTRWGIKESLPAIMECRFNRDLLVRQAVAESLLDFSEPQYESELCELMHDSSPLVRMWAVRAYTWHFPGRKARSQFETILRTERFQIVKAALYAGLYRVGKKSFLIDLLALLKYRHYLARAVAAVTLGEWELYMPTKKDRRVIIERVQERLQIEKSVAVREKLVWCLQRFGVDFDANS